MNKLTKLLSVFAIAGAIGTGVAGLTGCHKHTYSDEWKADGAAGHYHVATCKHTDKHTETVPHGTANEQGKCPDCGYQLNDPTPTPTPTPGPAEEVKATGVEITGNGATKVGKTITLGTEITPANSTEKAKWEITEGATLATIDENTGALTAANEVGDVTVKVTVGAVSSIKKVRIVKDEEGLFYITSAAELEMVRTTASLSGTYKLACDIDMDGVTLGATKAVLKEGVTFDGDGYTISNAVYKASEKTGILFESSTGGTATNVKFLNCVANGTGNETVGIVVGLGNGGTFSKLEFNSCSAACNNYGGFVVGRNTNQATINISEITTKNGCSVTTQQYGGLLVGDILGTSTVNFTDLHLDGELKGSSGNGSFVAGRTRAGATVSIQNAVISATIANPTNNGIFSGNGACAKLTVKNVLILKSNSALIAKVAPTASDYANIATVTGVTVTGATASNGENTVAYLTDTIGLDFENKWTAEGDGYRLKAASTNIKSADATIKKVKLNTANATTRFKVGEDFSTAGLVVMGAYSDGVQLVLNGETGYEVDSSAVKNEAGTYTVVIKSKENGDVKATYDVVVAAETGFVVYDEFMAHTYLVGDSIDTANLVIKSTWSDGIEETIDKKNYSLLDASYDMDTAGAYEVKVKYGNYEEKIIKISVSATVPVPVDGKIYVNVDSTYTGVNGARVNGVETFNTVADAVDYLEACKLDNSVQKVVYVGEGTYEAKITTSLANLVLIGKGTDKSVLTYSAVEGMTDPVSGKVWGMDCATLHINGEGFKAYNLTIRNDFNYIRDNKKYASPQGFALTINGDKAVIENCLLYGNQDTLFFKNGRTYLKNTTIEGNVDFIFGENTGLAYFDHCTINAISRYDASTSNKSNNGYVTAMKGDPNKKPDYGYIFDTCSFTHGEGVEAGSMSLGRPWGAAATVAMINCNFSAAYSTHGFKTDLKDPAKPNEYLKGRWEEMSGNSPVYTTDDDGKVTGADFVEYGSTGAGAITTAVTGGTVIDATAAADYTAANLFAGTNGGITWTSGAWTYATDEALLVALAVDKATTSTGLQVSANSVEVTEGGTVEFTASLTPWNLADKTISIEVADTSIATYACGKVTGVAEGSTTITVTYGDNQTQVIPVTVSPKDPTVRTSVNYVYAQNGREDGEAEPNSGKIKFSDMVVNNSWLRWKDDNAYIKFTALKGTIINITVNGGETLMFNTDEVAATADKVVTYTVPEDGEVVIKRKSGTNAYLRTISLNVPITEKYEYVYPYANNTTGEPAQGTAVENAPIYFTGAQHNNGWLKITGKIEFNVIAGTVIKINASSYDQGIILNGAETVLPKDEGTDNYTITITNDNAGIITLTPKQNQFYLKSIVVDPPATAVLEKFYVTSDDANLTGFAASSSLNWDDKGIIKLYSTANHVWGTDPNGKSYTDVNGTSHTSTNRLKSNGASSYIEIDLTGYVGEYTLSFAFAPSNNNRTAQLAAGDETPVYTIDNTTNKDYVGNATATLEGGKVYKFTWTNAYNF
ncbi:MAG: Ig-like domain-containing protein [Clostridia bacterium]|nr:Ig-like domain-containing protein [Clostridia bacterium]